MLFKSVLKKTGLSSPLACPATSGSPWGVAHASHFSLAAVARSLAVKGRSTEALRVFALEGRCCSPKKKKGAGGVEQSSAGPLPLVTRWAARAVVFTFNYRLIAVHSSKSLVKERGMMRRRCSRTMQVFTVPGTFLFRPIHPPADSSASSSTRREEGAKTPEAKRG